MARAAIATINCRGFFGFFSCSDHLAIYSIYYLYILSILAIYYLYILCYFLRKDLKTMRKNKTKNSKTTKK